MSIVLSKRLVAGLLLSALSFTAAANDELQRYFHALKSFQADFKQQVKNSQLGSVNEASGKLYILRPGKFRWNYQQPYEQQIVSDGKKVWIYDADLEQVTVKQVNASLSQTPAMLLSDDHPIEDSFDVTQFMGEDKLVWFELIPKGKDTSFTSIRMGFASEKLAQMVLEDNLGQITELRFSNSQRNLSLKTTLFDFTPPKGVDVFESNE